MSQAIHITIPPSAQGKRLSAFLAEEGYPLHADCGGKGKCGKCRITLLSGSLWGDPSGHTEALPDENGMLPACRVFGSEQGAVVSLPVDTTQASLLSEPSMSAVSISNCGIALDIGTTTLAIALVNTEDGRILRTMSRLNPQKSFGADVMSRIGAVMEDEQRLYLMQNLLLHEISDMINRLTYGEQIPLQGYRHF